MSRRNGATREGTRAPSIIPNQDSQAGGVGSFIMNAFRQDLEEIEAPVKKISDAVAEAGFPLTDVRILEIAIWQAVEPRGYYRTE